MNEYEQQQIPAEKTSPREGAFYFPLQLAGLIGRPNVPDQHTTKSISKTEIDESQK